MSARGATSLPSGLPWLSLTLTGVAVLAWWVDDVVGSALELERAALAHGQLWRLFTGLFTGHFAHWSTNHLVWDALVFGVVGGLYERRVGRARTAALLAISALAIGVAVLALRPDIARFRGLSGIDCALVVALARTAWRDALVRGDRRGAVLQALLLLGYGVKTMLELRTGLTLFVQVAPEGFRAVPLAHVVGGIVGWAVGVGWNESPCDEGAVTRADRPTSRPGQA